MNELLYGKRIKVLGEVIRIPFEVIKKRDSIANDRLRRLRCVALGLSEDKSPQEVDKTYLSYPKNPFITARQMPYAVKIIFDYQDIKGNNQVILVQAIKEHIRKVVTTILDVESMPKATIAIGNIYGQKLVSPERCSQLLYPLIESLQDGEKGTIKEFISIFLTIFHEATTSEIIFHETPHEEPPHVPLTSRASWRPESELIKDRRLQDATLLGNIKKGIRENLLTQLPKPSPRKRSSAKNQVRGVISPEQNRAKKKEESKSKKATVLAPLNTSYIKIPTSKQILENFIKKTTKKGKGIKTSPTKKRYPKNKTGEEISHPTASIPRHRRKKQRGNK